MKKFICLLLSVMMLLSFAACGDDNPTSSTDDSSTPGGVESNGKYLTVSVIDKGMGTAWIKDLAKRYRNKTGTTVDVKGSATLNEQMGSQLTSGEKTSDIYFCFNSQLEWVTWASTGAIVPLDDVIPEENFRNETVYKLGNYNGHKYYLPFAYNPTGIVYNVDYLNELGYSEFPDTWPELLQLCEDVNNSDLYSNYTGDKVAPMVWAGGTGDMVYLFRSLWAQVDPEGWEAYWGQDDKAGAHGEANKGLLVNDSTERVMQALIDLLAPTQSANGKSYYSANSHASSTGYSNIEAQTAFLEGNALFNITGAWFENEMQEEIAEYDETNYAFAAFPKLDPSKPASVSINLPGENFYISANGKNNDVEEAKNFLRYVLSEEGCQISHNQLNLPLCYKYDESKLNLTNWGKQVKAVADSASGAINGSDSKVFLSGVLTLNLNNYFTNMAQAVVQESCDYTNPRSMLTALYNYQIAGWDDAVNKIK